MIIQCEHCSTKFRFDDSKISDKEVTVRCAVCKQTFTVAKAKPDSSLITEFETTFEAPHASGILHTEELGDNSEKKSDVNSIVYSEQSEIISEKQEANAEESAITPAISKPAHEEAAELSAAPAHRKKNPLYIGFIIALMALIAAVLAYIGYTQLFADNSTVENGKITIRDIKASYITNNTIGELFVINGEAVNEFAKPRAAIQVRGMIYSEKGQVLADKYVFCGNSISKEQLATMTLDKIEASMANQFGDSLANMEVAPGKAIPFVIVIAKPPADAKDYGVDPIGSTVAASK